MKMKKTIGILLLVVFMAVAVVGCEKQPAADGDKDAGDIKIHVGVVEPVTGPQAPLVRRNMTAFRWLLK